MGGVNLDFRPKRDDGGRKAGGLRSESRTRTREPERFMLSGQNSRKVCSCQSQGGKYTTLLLYLKLMIFLLHRSRNKG